DIQSSDLATRKALGKRYLEENRLEEAIQVFAQFLRDNPSDMEGYLFLGDCYMIGGDAETALMVYNQAKEMDPQNVQVERRIQLAKLKKFVSSTDEKQKITEWMREQPSLPTQPQAVADMLQNFTPNSAKVSEEELLNAANLLKEIIHSPHPALLVAEKLDEITDLIPALLELNIRQAKADGRMDLVVGLSNLLENIQLQKLGQLSDTGYGEDRRDVQEERTLRILYADANPNLPILRSPFPITDLENDHCKIIPYQPSQAPAIEDFDVLVALHPFLDENIMELMAQAHLAKKKIALYLELDFEQMPYDHPAYEIAGFGSPARAKAYMAACLLADVICVPGESFANSLRQAGYKTAVVPTFYNRENLSQTRPNQLRHTINLGWIGYGDELEDVFQVKRMIVRVMREFPHVHLVIAGDVGVYQLFDSLPDARRLFIPLLQEEDVGYALNQMDALLLPLRNNPFHRSLSDYRLVAAGARGIPWIASPLPAISTWGEGGLIVNSLDEWHTYLRQLVLDDDLRRNLGDAGKRLASARTSVYQSQMWRKILNKLMDEKRA
ncbi:MAG: tetratricopeptide repeat protein, partial [Anaerolineales bacterium]